MKLEMATMLNEKLIIEITLMTFRYYTHHTIKMYLTNSNYNYLTNLLCMST